MYIIKPHIRASNLLVHIRVSHIVLELSPVSTLDRSKAMWASSYSGSTSSSERLPDLDISPDSIGIDEGEERTERERRLSELGFRIDEADRVFCGDIRGSVVGRACQADALGRARATPYPLHI